MVTNAPIPPRRECGGLTRDWFKGPDIPRGVLSIETTCPDSWVAYEGSCYFFHHALQDFTEAQKHAVIGRNDVKNWKAVPEVVDTLNRCEMHAGEPLKLVCGDHDQLCCHLCVAVDHRQCSNIQHIPDVAKGIQRNIEFQQIPNKIVELQKQLENMKDARMQNSTTLKKTRDAISDEIKTIRQKINELLDNIEVTTLQDLDGMIAKLENSIKKDIETCDKITTELQNMIAVFQTKAKSSESKSYIAYRKSKDMISQANDHLHSISNIWCHNVIFQGNNLIEKLLLPIKTFGAIGKQTVMAISDPNHVFRIEEYNEYNVQISDNEYQCDIRGICEMPNEDLVIADFGNCKVKLLDKEYRVVDHRVVPGQPCDVYHIGGNEVVVCVNSEIYFIYVVKSQLVNSRELSFSHGCYAAAHHYGQLYVSSGNALYVYTMSGQKVKKLYEDKSGNDTVKKCAISNDGKKIFITNFNHH
ncbi:uncharacterized protein LOC128202814 [Mya arenaria]|uniref:uncharacterized protein LOC128202814 n=1 Tax=Mya arenaria TaxID=6604 RepID=UPI0022E33D8B|nr:uncharacterized protein LOC128202814 [Mya arenaria]